MGNLTEISISILFRSCLLYDIIFLFFGLVLDFIFMFFRSIAATENPFKSILKTLEKPDGGEFGKYYSLPALNDPRIGQSLALFFFLITLCFSCR